MQIHITHRFNGNILFKGEFGSLKIALEVAVRNDADLRGADLRGANLRGANLSYANLRYANLSYANLRDADLTYANLSYANLRYADPSYADLSYADLSYANLRYANLSDADLRYANSRYAITEPATPEEVARLDAVREIVLAKPKRLDMTSWHSSNWTPEHTPEEEHSCGSAHCIAGWLQALSPDNEIRAMEPYDAGKKLAPASSYMFFASDDQALEWLKERRYAKEAA